MILATYTHISGDITSLDDPGFIPFPRITRWVLEGSVGSDFYFRYPGLDGRTYSIVAHGNLVDADGNFNILGMTSVERYFGGQLIDQVTDVQFYGGEPGSFMGGADTFNGSSGRDVMGGAGGNDLIFGRAGDDALSGDEGADTIYGGAGNDTIGGGGYNDGTLGDRVYGGGGNDIVDGSPGDDSIYGGSGDDVLRGGEGFTAGGNDRLDGGTGADLMDGGTGNDIYYVDNLGDQVIEGQFGPQGGWDVVFTSVSFDLHPYAQGFSEIEVVDAGSAEAGVTISGNEYTTVLRGSDHDDVLMATQLIDTHSGVTLNGRGGADTMYGSTYDDTFFVDSSNDVVIDLFLDDTGGLRDTVFAGASYALGAGQRIERLYAAAGSVGLALTGNEVANLIRGGDGSDTISGGAGHDTVLGGLGADVFELRRFPVNWDRISDFSHGNDLIALSESQFGELDGPAKAFSDRFLANSDGSVANGGTADTRIVYDIVTGRLYFDPDGTGARASSLIAVLTGMPVVDFEDFLIT